MMNSSINRTTAKKQLLFHALLFSIVLFISSSIVATVFHNDDIKHKTHPLNHSPVCQWLHEGKLCNRNSTGTTPALNFLQFLSLVTTLFILIPCLLLVGKQRDSKDPLNFLYLAAAQPSRAPPAI